MREAVIVSYARTGLAKSARGGFNMTPTVTMAAHAIKHAVAKSGVDKGAIEDVVLGNVAHGGGNLGRQAALLAGLPITTSGVTVNRFCSSGLQTIAMAANNVRNDGADVVVAGGVESISMPNTGAGGPANFDPELTKLYPAIFMPMIDTADIVAKRYNVSRESQDEYSLESQLRMAAAQQSGKFKDECSPGPTYYPNQGRDRPDEDQDEGGQQGDEGRDHRRLRGRSRRVQPPRHHPGRPAKAGSGEG